MINIKKLFKTPLEKVVSGLLALSMLLNSVNLRVKAETIPQNAFGANIEYGLVTGKTLQKVYVSKNPNFDKERENERAPTI